MAQMGRITTKGRRAVSLAGLPTEILLDIYRDLDIASIFELSLTSQFFHDLLAHRKASILLPVMIREFSPFDELVQVYTASADDLLCTHGGGLYQPRRVIFKRYDGDVGLDLTPSKALTAAPLAPAQQNDQEDAGFTQVTKKGKAHPFFSSASSSLKTKILTSADIAPLLKHCQLVRKWEELFPSMRWFYDPEQCRSLRPHEQARFRRALYRWWLYGVYFHEDLPRPRVGLPEPRVDDVRTSQMRRHPTSELLELMDLVETMKDVVLHYICPRLDPEQQSWACSGATATMDQPALIDSVDRAQSLTDSWMDQSRWSRIVKTYAKLGPRELMYYFENIYSYPADRLIREIRAAHPTFTFDQESIQVAVRCALDERDWLSASSSRAVPSLAEDGRGGIVDFDDERDGERAVFGTDGCGDGGLPEGISFVRSFSQWSPRGDDGAGLKEEYWRGNGGGSDRLRHGVVGWA